MVRRGLLSLVIVVALTGQDGPVGGGDDYTGTGATSASAGAYPLGPVSFVDLRLDQCGDHLAAERRQLETSAGVVLVNEPALLPW
jgi:hypothetical protein